MSYNPDIHHRRSIRLRSYDYSWPGVYFVTVVVRGRTCLFGGIEGGNIRLNDAGLSIEQNWLDLPHRFPFCDVGDWLVMPNHFHGVLIFHSTDEEKPIPTSTVNRVEGTPQDSLSRVVQAFKSLTTTEYIKGVHENNWTPFEGKLWLRNYWERVIRSEAEWERANNYIFNNPAQWESDKHHPKAHLRCG